MSENKKILGTRTETKFGINFKSTSESRMYEILKQEGFNVKYEEKTFTLTRSFKPTIAFYKRKGKKKPKFVYDMTTVPSITYTPDFTFMYNGLYVIIECKGFENDVYPYKRILFRSYLERLAIPVAFYQVQTIGELRTTINKIKMESGLLASIRKKVVTLPEKDIPIANKYLDARDWESLGEIVASAIKRVNKSRSSNASERSKEIYKDVDLSAIDELNVLLFQYTSNL